MGSAAVDVAEARAPSLRIELRWNPNDVSSIKAHDMSSIVTEGSVLDTPFEAFATS
jgi:hypothetical protein